jgi:hypothetical protein
VEINLLRNNILNNILSTYILFTMKLQDLKIVFICPDHNEKYHKRKLHMENMLSRIGCKNVTHYKSGNEQFPKCLSLAYLHILSENLDTPVLIIEDDVIFKGNDTFDYEDSADAIYLGISKCAAHATENRDEGSLKVEPYSMTQVRVKNMLSTHAIIYKSRKFKEAVISKIKSSLEGNINWETDILIARLQPDFLILANMKPNFYQSALLNKGKSNVERITNFRIGYIIGFGQEPPPENELIEDGSESKVL